MGKNCTNIVNLKADKHILKTQISAWISKTSANIKHKIQVHSQFYDTKWGVSGYVYVLSKHVFHFIFTHHMWMQADI